MASTEDDELVDVLQSASRRRRPGTAPAGEQPTTEPAASPAPAPATEASAAGEPRLAPPAEPVQQPNEDQAPKPAAAAVTAYGSQLLKSARGKKGKSIQLDEENHSALTHIAGTMGGVTIADLLHNIVRLHFQEYGPAIQQMLKEKEALNKKKKLPFHRS